MLENGRDDIATEGAENPELRRDTVWRTRHRGGFIVSVQLLAYLSRGRASVQLMLMSTNGFGEYCDFHPIEESIAEENRKDLLDVDIKELHESNPDLTSAHH